MPKNADDNGDFRKRFQKWKVLKTLFMVSTGKIGDFESVAVKSVKCHRLKSKKRTSIQDGGLSFDVNACAILFHRFRAFLTWTGENDTKTLVQTKMFCYVFAEMKNDTYKNVLVWMGLLFYKASLNYLLILALQKSNSKTP